MFRVLGFRGLERMLGLLNRRPITWSSSKAERYFDAAAGTLFSHLNKTVHSRGEMPSRRGTERVLIICVCLAAMRNMQQVSYGFPQSTTVNVFTFASRAALTGKNPVSVFQFLIAGALCIPHVHNVRFRRSNSAHRIRYLRKLRDSNASIRAQNKKQAFTRKTFNV